MPDASFYVAVIHNQNTAAKNLGDPRWQRRPLDEVGRLLILDRDFYARLRNSGLRAGEPRRPPRRSPWTPRS
jgi:hypothetical protein